MASVKDLTVGELLRAVSVVETALQKQEAAHTKALTNAALQTKRKMARLQQQRDNWREIALRYQKELAQARTALINHRRAN